MYIMIILTNTISDCFSESYETFSACILLLKLEWTLGSRQLRTTKIITIKETCSYQQTITTTIRKRTCTCIANMLSRYYSTCTHPQYELTNLVYLVEL